MLFKYGSDSSDNQIGFGEKFFSGASIKNSGIVPDSKQELPRFYEGGIRASTPSVSPTPVPVVPAPVAPVNSQPAGGDFGQLDAYIIVILVTLLVMGILLIYTMIRKQRRRVRLPSFTNVPIVNKYAQDSIRNSRGLYASASFNDSIDLKRT